MDNNLLSQADIDALVNNMTASSPPKPRAAQPPSPNPASVPPAQPAQVVPPPPNPAPPVQGPTNFTMKKMSLKDPDNSEPETISTSLIDSLTTQNNRLQERINRLEAKVQKLEQLEKVRSGFISHVNPQQVAALEQKVAQLSEILQKTTLKLQGTLGYDIYHQFTCEKCGTREQVATVYKCTHCGHQTWLGWRAKR